MRCELRETIRATGIPCVLVTYALRDALELGDRICVMLSPGIQRSRIASKTTMPIVEARNPEKE